MAHNLTLKSFPQAQMLGLFSHYAGLLGGLPGHAHLESMLTSQEGLLVCFVSLPI